MHLAPAAPAEDDAIVVVLVARLEDAEMATVDDRVTRLEAGVNRMETDAKIHFAELRKFIATHVEGLEARLDALDWKVTWLILPTLAVIGTSVVWLALTMPR
jgi:hypothetical protein